MQQKRNQQAEIRLGSHGEDYGSWMSNPVFYIIGGITALAVVLAVLSFSVFHITVLGVLFSVVAAALVALLVWITWIRCQYAFGGGGIMEQVHRVVLSHLDYDGQGSLLEVGCGSGALSIRAALTWPESKVTGMDYWGAVYNYSKTLCEKNAASEGVASRCVFRHGDANHLDFPAGKGRLHNVGRVHAALVGIARAHQVVHAVHAVAAAAELVRREALAVQLQAPRLLAVARPLLRVTSPRHRHRGHCVIHHLCLRLQRPLRTAL